MNTFFAEYAQFFAGALSAVVISVVNWLGYCLRDGRQHRLQLVAEKSREGRAKLEQISREKRAKLEELVMACYQIEEWCRQQEDFCEGRAPRPSELSTMAKIRTIVFLYVPEIDNNYARRISVCMRAYYMILLKSAEQKTADGDAKQKTDECYEKLVGLREKLVNEVSRIMEKERDIR